MNDKLSASWVLVVGTLFLGYYYWRTKGGSPAKVDGSRETLMPSSKSGSILDQILALGKQFGLPTPTLGQMTGGKHVPGSLHYQGRAVDFSVRGVSEDVLREFTMAAEEAGFQVHHEEKGSTPFSTGTHIHVSKPHPGGGW
jgi:hypothetical protein